MKLLLFTLVEVVGSLVFPEIQGRQMKCWGEIIDYCHASLSYFRGWTNVTLVDEPFLPTVKELGDMEAPETAARPALCCRLRAPGLRVCALGGLGAWGFRV